ncbi:MAG: TRAM domain-containing protein [Thermodesulfobacteriota bacterium]
MRTLMELQKKISLKKYRQMVGRKMEVLVEEPSDQGGVLRGRLQIQAPEIDGCVFLRGKARPGDWVEARITQIWWERLKQAVEKRPSAALSGRLTVLAAWQKVAPYSSRRHPSSFPVSSTGQAC